ncbi:MAG: biotin/lipoate--protein ligase family protein [Xanthobacteraceae bacterium]
MPLGSRSRAALAPQVELPPPFTLVTLREVGDAFAHAVKLAPDQGAGTLVYVGRFDLAEFAVVLEPDEPLRTARRAFYIGMVALIDALLTHAPPEKPVAIDWPDTIRIDGGLVGGGRLGWPNGAAEDEPPPWLVFGGMIRTVSMTDNPGLHPMAAALEEEGFTDVSAAELVASFARHLMVHIDALQEYGFGAISRAYLQRLPGESGVRRDIDENGDLLVRRASTTDPQRMDLKTALARPSWLDPKTRGPRL